MPSEKDCLIVAQNSATGASTIVAAAIAAGTPAEEIIPLFDAVRNHIFNGSLALGTSAPVAAAPAPAPTSVAEAAAAPAPVAAVPAPIPTPAPEAPAPQPQAGGDEGSVVFKFGKHQGKSIAQVFGEDRKYLEWAAENLTTNQFMNDKVNGFLRSMAVAG